MFQEGGSTGIQAVEQVLARAFEQHGYSVLDREIIGQTLRREADVVKGYDIEAAKLLGTRLGATIVVSGKSQTRPRKKPIVAWGTKKVTVSQGDVGAKAILASSGKVWWLKMRMPANRSTRQGTLPWRKQPKTWPGS